ncbi:MAG: DUF1858 domain-containing protein [Candidatus Micrarchaeia archaeon]|jgi:hybrid cluster-associated redox disulfide protein
MAFVISRTSPIGDLVLNHPVAASVLLEHGFHCIGCGLAAYDTLESGAAVHGYDDAQIDALVQEIKDAAKKEEELLLQAAAKSGAAAASEAAAGKSKAAAKESEEAAKTKAPAADAKENKKAGKKAKDSKPG